MRALGVDGTYLEKTEATKWQDASGRSGIEIPEKSESGKWRVKEGLLLMTPAIPDVMMSSVPLEKMIPIMELLDRHYTCVGIDLHATEEVTWNRASDE